MMVKQEYWGSFMMSCMFMWYTYEKDIVEKDDYDNSDDDNKNGENIEFHLPQSCLQMSQ